MIEAVNSVLSNAPLVRQNAEQQSGARSSSNVSDAVRETVQAPYLDIIRLDVDYDTAVLLLRDSQSGDTVQQIPSEDALIQSRRQAETSERVNEIRDTQSNGVEQEAGSDTGNVATVQSSPISSQELSAFTSGQRSGGNGESSSTFSTEA